MMVISRVTEHTREVCVVRPTGTCKVTFSCIYKERWREKLETFKMHAINETTISFFLSFLKNIFQPVLYYM